MEEQFSRTELLIGKKAMERLAASRVAVFGLGGVGGIAAEALARVGIGQLVLVDNDCVSVSNLNRQIIALQSTVGRKKTEVMRERIREINPSARVELHSCFYLPGNTDNITSGCDYVIDAIDTVSGKLALIEECRRNRVPIISSMGTGNKRNPRLFEVADIYSTSVCPLARVMRRELRKRGIEGLKVVFSREEPVSSATPPGSLVYVTSTAGLLLAAETVNDLISSCGV